MRQLKHHEQRLLKKVDFLDVSPQSINFRLACSFVTQPDLSHCAPFIFTHLSPFSGNKMPLSVRSRL